MQQTMNATVAVAVIGLAVLTAPAQAQDRTSGKATTPSSQTKAATPQDTTTPPGNSPVHRFFNAWGNGMQRGANAIGLDKDPLAGKIPEVKVKPLFSGNNEPATPNR